MTTGMIVLAGGIGKRIGRPFPKQFLLLGGKPLIIHVLEKARAIPEIERVVVTCPEGHLEATRELIANHAPRRQVHVHRRRGVAPGVGLQRACSRSTASTRSSSTRPSARWSRRPSSGRSSRPRTRTRCTASRSRSRSSRATSTSRGCSSATSSSTSSCPRSSTAASCSRAHEAARRDGAYFTEDAGLFFQYVGEPVRILAGSDQNIKITVPTDTVTAEAIYADVLGRGS